ncbi:MAG: chromosome segregation protein SMC [Alphaproteobacteria bacterium]
MQFTKIRLSGFKSFIDPTELLIEPGMTGIVGPNGCGKSNIIEALRWVMGETSAKKLRGGEMDDVIFGGTAQRSIRDLAEVTLYLDNSERTAPAAFNESQELEVTRRIDRGSGSSYRINGREVRARDVQLLFADAATGSRSTALVSQGQIGALIAAKPVDRRALIEEAAGITGLHSRRHEAELRLRAADTNLERLNDVVIALEEQLRGLKRQSRQASRYRNLSDHIRRAEAALFHVRWTDASKTLEEAGYRIQAAESRVQECTRSAGTAATAQADIAAKLPALRDAEAGAAAVLQRLMIGRESLDAEETRVRQACEDGQNRLDQIASDSTRERRLAAEAAEATTRIDDEITALNRSCQEESEAEREAEEALAAAKTDATRLEDQLSQMVEKIAADEARRADLVGRQAELESRQATLRERIEDNERDRGAIQSAATDKHDLDAAEATVAKARGKLNQARDAAEAADQAHIDAMEAETVARDEAQLAENAAAQLRAEEKALRELLQVDDANPWTPLSDELTVEAGFETALGAALGDDLTASLDQAAPAHWRALPPLDDAPALPDGVRPLGDFVKAPDALARRLSQTGLVDSTSDGASLRASLVQGQRLVSRDGALWRWDGFTITPDASTPAAARLDQLQRLREITGELGNAESRLGEARARLTQAQDALVTATKTEREAREAVKGADLALQKVREESVVLAQTVAARSSQIEGLEIAHERLEADLAEAIEQAKAVEKAAGTLGDIESNRNQAASLKTKLTECRAALDERKRAYDFLIREIAARGQRLADLGREREMRQTHADNANHQIHEFEARKTAVEQDLARLADRPQQIAAERLQLTNRIEEAELARQASADALAKGESALAEADKGLRAAEAALAEAREDRARCEGGVNQARQALDELDERIRERLQCTPADVFEISGLKDDKPADHSVLEARLERLIRERDNMGPVNLRAEAEAEELGERITTMATEREDLVHAIARLRQGINQLNREGRARFLAAFEAVNTHFQELFTRLFGGGVAHLALTESDDPLEAGIEIMARPPGKRLQIMSLLSGGEQALTTIALLFGVFLTNPAPICILDEVDAPLDDANVGRFCDLVEELAHNSSTRFLIVTHHRTTMSRMDRLFGVTMAERGVSQLVSVDLQEAGRLRAA